MTAESLPRRLEVAVATMDATDPEPLAERMGLAGAAANVLVINQCPGMDPDALPAPVERAGLRMYSFAEQGLSRSRNRALSLARSRYLLLADDDLGYLPGFERDVLRAFAQHRDAAAITFQYVDASTGKPAKDYPAHARRHDALSIASVSSVEIAVDRRRLGARARFDPDFGLGSEVPGGEEAVFLADMRAAGLTLRYEPLAICSHPGLGSGHGSWDRDTVRAKAAVLRRMYPRRWRAIAAGLGLLKYRSEGKALGVGRWSRAWLDAIVRGR